MISNNFVTLIAGVKEFYFQFAPFTTQELFKLCSFRKSASQYSKLTIALCTSMIALII